LERTHITPQGSAKAYNLGDCSLIFDSAPKTYYDSFKIVRYHRHRLRPTFWCLEMYLQCSPMAATRRESWSRRTRRLYYAAVYYLHPSGPYRAHDHRNSEQLQPYSGGLTRITESRPAVVRGPRNGLAAQATGFGVYGAAGLPCDVCTEPASRLS